MVVAVAPDKGKGWLIAYESGSTDPINYDTIRFASFEAVIRASVNFLIGHLFVYFWLRRVRGDSCLHFLFTPVVPFCNQIIERWTRHKVVECNLPMHTAAIIPWGKSRVIHSCTVNVMIMCDISVSARSIMTGKEVFFNFDKDILGQEWAIVIF